MAAKVAKVAMVAVPTVLGIASIRVYRVSEPPTEGLIPHETLSVYNPLPQSTGQFQFVAEKPGALENGFGYTRETVVVPSVQAVKGACVSVKNGALHVYYAGEDVYHFLKDPPSGFVPRVGCIAMAGLLGAFLARKGSRLQRLAASVGMASAGAAVCYPAQTVGLVKLSSKKIYSAGQWTGSTVSSLFKSKPKELPASQPQPEDVPKSESPVVEESPAPEVPPASEVPPAEGAPSSDTETLVESVAAEPVPVSEEPTTTVVTEEPSPADPSLEAVVESAPAASEEPAPSPEETAPSTTAPTEPIDSSQESIPIPVSTEASPEAVAEPVTEAVSEASPEAVVEAVSEAIPEAVVEAVVEAVSEARSEAVVEAVVEAVSEAIPEAVVEAASEASPEAVVEAASEASPEAVVEAVSEAATEDLPADTSGGGASVQADPAMMDFGQSSPEDDDLYSTRTS